METGNGKWRFTSPTHVVRAFYQAMLELEKEGGVLKRFERYTENHSILVNGMKELGFRTILPLHLQSPIITGFFSPQASNYNFNEFYQSIKNKGFVIYPGKVTDLDSFRIGNIGHVFPEDMQQLVKAISTSLQELNIGMP